ncbi:hypothetical protein [Metasolibacillus fluoroglycofenilyticus]|uniref:hypothetical protein n=1 Tax=Metasolibacillus fluoroglycofenilyticus TaxID=1239396 RepID=UPI000D3C5C3B|nr:hypothetical protein [Metasolibacillus fluoroglycofenilyticus]
MKLLSIIGLTMLLTACGATQSQQEEPPMLIFNQATAQVEEEPFILKLISDKEQYKVGEKLVIRAELIYEGEESAINIAHGGSWLFLETTNLTEDYHFGAAMNEPLIYTKLTKGQPLVEDYGFSGGAYIEGQGGKPYSEELFQQMAKMNFPPGQYEIKAITHFGIDEIIGDIYKLEAKIIFEVIE